MEHKKYIVFLVDDDPAFRFLTRKLCERVAQVKEVIEFEDIYDALRQIMAHKKQANLLPDVILLDLDFPTLNGFEFLEGFVELQPSLAKKTPVFVLSSSLLKADHEKVLEYKIVKDFIPKPVSLDQIQKIIDSI